MGYRSPVVPHIDIDTGVEIDIEAVKYEINTCWKILNLYKIIKYPDVSESTGTKQCERNSCAQA